MGQLERQLQASQPTRNLSAALSTTHSWHGDFVESAGTARDFSAVVKRKILAKAYTHFGESSIVAGNGHRRA